MQNLLTGTDINNNVNLSKEHNFGGKIDSFMDLSHQKRKISTARKLKF